MYRSIATLILAVLAAAAGQATTADARPGTYTDYDFEQPGLPPTFNRYDMFVTWEKAPISGAIYPAFTFGFQGGGGYMGTQLGGLDHRVLFSIWDSSNDQETALPAEPGCRRFGGEGTGTQCGKPYPWVEGREYRLRLELVGTVAEGDEWRGSIKDTVTGVETTIGTIRLLNTGPYHGYGKLRRGASTFTEYFGGEEESCDRQPYARIRWRGPYADESMLPPSRATASWYGYPCPTHNDQTSPAVPIVVVETGGTETPITSQNGAQLWPSCSASVDLHDDLVKVSNAACRDSGLQAPATTPDDVSDYGLWSYPSGSAVQGTVTGIANGTEAWAVFYKEPGFAGESFCLGPHRFAELHAYAGWNDVVASHRILRSEGPCSAPPECTVQVPAQRCGDGAVQEICGEQCDFGPAADGGCCDSSCQLRPAGTSCIDGQACTQGDACDSSGACQVQSGCGDGVIDAACEQCDTSGGSECCAGSCRFEGAGTSCNDDDTCTDGDECNGGGACYGTVEPSESCGTGLAGAYFDEVNFTQLKVVRIDPRIDFDWGQDAPDPSMDPDRFSVRWTGSVLPQHSEQYSFHARTDDGVRLWVNDQLLIDQWTVQPPTETTGSIMLEAGRKYPIVMEFSDNYYGAVASLAWSSLHQPKHIVPQSALFPPGCAPISKARLVLSNLGGAMGNETMVFKGKIRQPAGFTPLDAVSRGAQVLVEDLGAPGAAMIYELSRSTEPVPAGARAAVCSETKKDGWTVNFKQTRYIYTNVTGALPTASCQNGSARGLRRLELNDKRASSSRSIDFAIDVSKTNIEHPKGALRATVVLSASSSDESCGQVDLSCVSSAAGTTLVCR